jgi:hypothetical protein
MAQGSTQPLTETSTRNLPGCKGQSTRKVDLPAICGPIVYNVWDLDASQPYGPPRPVAGIALPLFMVDSYPITENIDPEICILSTDINKACFLSGLVKERRASTTS